MEKLIGREKEREELMRCYNSERSEFVIVYGRRRIGKTFLVNAVFHQKYAFYFTGSHKATKERQLERFAMTLQMYGKLTAIPSLPNWYKAFDALQLMLQSLPNDKKKVIFLDEMPWIDTFNSEFVAAFEDFWNTWAAMRDDIMLIACGSSTSWMIDKLIENQGGLHNRITSRINLRPFNLSECEQYLQYHQCSWDRYQMIQCYMCLGGIPYYLSLIEPKKSFAQNIDILFFKDGPKLANEFNELYSTLFKEADKYIDIVRLLASHREGLTRKEIGEKTKTGGGGLTQRLENLENSDFIMGYNRFGTKKKGIIYRLKDFYTLFYLRFIENIRTQNEDYWTKKIHDSDVLVWQGLTFELICLTHLGCIKQKLGIQGMLVNASSWRSSQPNDNTQIDLVIERADRMIHLCEMKFSVEPYIITKEYEEKLRRRMAIFRAETKTRKPLLTTFVTTYGILPNIHSGIVASEIVMDDLFMSH